MSSQQLPAERANPLALRLPPPPPRFPEEDDQRELEDLYEFVGHQFHPPELLEELLE